MFTFKGNLPGRLFIILDKNFVNLPIKLNPRLHRLKPCSITQKLHFHWIIFSIQPYRCSPLVVVVLLPWWFSYAYVFIVVNNNLVSILRHKNQVILSPS